MFTNVKLQINSYNLIKIQKLLKENSSTYGFREKNHCTQVLYKKISVWRTIPDFHVLRFIFKIIFEMKYFNRNYFFLLIASALTLSLIHI